MDSKFKFRNMSPVELFYIGIALIVLPLLFKMGSAGPLPLVLIFASIFELFFRKQKKLTSSNLVSLFCAGVLCFILVMGLKAYVINELTMQTDALEPKIPKGAHVYYVPSRSFMFKIKQGDLVIYNVVSDRKYYVGELKNFIDKENCEVFRTNTKETVDIPISQIKGKIVSIEKTSK